MKRRIAVLAAVFALAVGMLGGCGNNAQQIVQKRKKTAWIRAHRMKL